MDDYSCQKFVRYCCFGNYKKVKQSNINNIPLDYLNLGFISACRYNNLKIIKYLYNYASTHNVNLNYTVGFFDALTVSNLNICKWMYQHLQIHLDYKLLATSLSNSKLNAVKWTLQNMNIDFRNNNAIVVAHMIKANRYNIVKWIINNTPIYEKMDVLVMCAIYYKMEKILSLLLSTVKNHDELYNKILIKQCYGGTNYNIVNWVINKPNLHIHTEAPLIASINDNVVMLNHLFNYIDLKYENCLFLKEACLSGSINAAKWIYEKINMSLTEIHDFNNVFLKVCQNNDINIASWLASICKNYYFKLNDHNKIDKYGIKNKFSKIKEAKSNSELLEYCDNIILDNISRTCIICMEDKDNIIRLCDIDDHVYCIDCFCSSLKEKCLLCFNCKQITLFNPSRYEDDILYHKSITGNNNIMFNIDMGDNNSGDYGFDDFGYV